MIENISILILHVIYFSLTCAVWYCIVQGMVLCMVLYSAVHGIVVLCIVLCMI